MASRFKRLVHRSKQGETPREHYVQGGDSELPTFPYESAVALNEPVRGNYPIRGNTSSSYDRSDTEEDRNGRRLRHRTSLPAANSQPPTHGSTIIPVRNPSSTMTQTNGIQDSPSRPEAAHDYYERPRSWHVPPSQGIRNSKALPPVPRAHPAPSHEAILNRARYDSEDTDVKTRMARPVTHETIHREIHHIREERITREIHNHEIYHRVLPVIDVEVLPARHFLPVEGGGLAEVHAEDVSGRSKNWVVAETVSKIPSGEIARKGRTQFTAREFLGTEGDSQRYRASDGHVVTEQTWVHPPEMETGGRDTGQTWPLEFGKLSLNDRDDRKDRKVSQSHRVKRKEVGGRAGRVP